MDNKTLEILITAEAKKIIEKSNLLFSKKLNIEAIKLNFKLRGVVAGRAGYDGTLKFNLVLASENLTDFFNDTIPHEIAHLYTFILYPNAKPHGKEWRYIMSKMGYIPSRCHNYSTQTVKQARKPKIKYIYKCPCGKQFLLSSLIHNKVQASHNGFYYRYCKRCKGKLIYTGQMTQK